MDERTPWTIRVHIYGARDLLSSDSNGLSDPYVKAYFYGLEEKTRIIEKTLDPQWFETLEFNSELPPLSHSPEVVLQVIDSNNLITKDVKLGKVRISLTDDNVVRGKIIIRTQERIFESCLVPAMVC